MQENTLKSAKNGVFGAGVWTVTKRVTERKPQKANVALCGWRPDSPPNGGGRANRSHIEQGFCIDVRMVTTTVRTAVTANHAAPNVRACEHSHNPSGRYLR
jgi:hypothetical protein